MSVESLLSLVASAESSYKKCHQQVTRMSRVDASMQDARICGCEYSWLFASTISRTIGHASTISRSVALDMQQHNTSVLGYMHTNWQSWIYNYKAVNPTASDMQTISSLQNCLGLIRRKQSRLYTYRWSHICVCNTPVPTAFAPLSIIFQGASCQQILGNVPISSLGYRPAICRFKESR